MPRIRLLAPLGLSLAVVAAALLTHGSQAQDEPSAPQAKKALAKKAAQKKQALVIPEVPASEQICFALYTVQDGILKLTAQLYPLAEGAPREVRLEVNRDGQWTEIARTGVRENEYDNGKGDRSWTAHFRVENWDHGRDIPYRLRHGTEAQYEGLVRKDPVDKDEIVIAAFSCNGNNDRRLKPDMIANLKAQDPDLLFFSGDQSYDHTDHLYAWLLFGEQFGDIIKDRPTISIPDDHDVGQGNIWGAAGRKAATSAGPDGGYFMSPNYVNEVQFAQTSNLPDPYDATLVEQGIGVYYTALDVGRVSFAIIEDRKWKTGPEGLIPQQGPRADHITDPNYDPASLDVAGAELLGDRQLQFLREWGQDWKGVEMKSVLSQTIFAGVPHLHSGNRLVADLDSNGWPQTPRDKALEEMRRAFALHVCGDQHLACVIRYGINTWNDAGYCFCVPSIVNYYQRAWEPLTPPSHAVPTALPNTGEYLDGLGNHITTLAYVNPDPARADKYGGEWGLKAEGYGLIRFDLKKRTTTLECWPRGVDVQAPDAEQYPGWPITCSQLDQYGREPKAWLPTIEVVGLADPVVQVVDATSTPVYTLRIQGTRFRPFVFEPGNYTIRVGNGEDGSFQVRQNLEASLDPNDGRVLRIPF